ncbi:diacylglycerol kinase family protein [Asticcacaulis sp. EMRT-3]|uniref:diacylglycerol/lipid kinase family protein n=1 Tax=Asticcacaulis sp. EMRT-3 TaxID=3040349 RepID=UPI0024AF7EEE|nr:diacylglycerol kinase family protein [Asticcacaulis sp. EMRT-3]MDI7776415.1 diacylglycerol kinase family protein [Asticcacaulis sp. EMRT-3]
MAKTTFNILINAKSGTVLSMGQPAIDTAVTQSGLPLNELCFSEPEEMSANLARLAGQAHHLLIGGGDGSIREAAKYLAERNKPFGVLPFGTMNLLAHDLGIDTLEGALAGYAAGAEESRIDAGFVNGEIFLCCASIGTMPQASRFRERKRLTHTFLLMPQLFLFILRNLDMHKRERIRIAIDGKAETFRTPAVVVSANRFADSQTLTESNFKRHALSGGELAVYVFTTTSHATHLRFMWRLLFGRWLQDPALIEHTGQTVRIDNHHRRDLVSIDGEIMKLKTPLEISLKPRFLHVLLPADEGQP